jgi:hypothetical protein
MMNNSGEPLLVKGKLLQNNYAPLLTTSYMILFVGKGFNHRKQGSFDSLYEEDETDGSIIEEQEELQQPKFDCLEHYNNAGLFSRIFFTWLSPIMKCK